MTGLCYPLFTEKELIYIRHNLQNEDSSRESMRLRETILNKVKELAWQPIATSPMNLEVLISDGEYVYAAICRYHGGEPDEDWAVPMASCGYRSVIRKPTHWMPKPEPPQ